MRILLLLSSITLHVWGKKKHFLIETKDDHEQPAMTEDANGNIEADYSLSLDDGNEESQCYCGQTNKKSKGQRIHGGLTTKRNEYPWMVRLFGNFNFELCGGTLINSRWVLTAGHCAEAGTVSLGDHDKRDPNEDTEVWIKSSEYIRHPEYKFIPGEKVPQFDIALIKLTKDIDFMKHPHIRPVCLPENADEDYAGWKVLLTGWGLIRQSKYADLLQEITGEVKTNLQCSKLEMGCKGIEQEQCSVSGIPDNMLCVTFPKGKNCAGDSGSPLVTKTVGGNYEQIGVMSFTSVGCNHTAPRYGGYARVTKVLNWIKDTMGTGHTDCPKQ